MKEIRWIRRIFWG